MTAEEYKKLIDEKLSAYFSPKGMSFDCLLVMRSYMGATPATT